MYLSDSGFSVEGSSADANETTVSFTNPTADRTITFPDATGNVAVFTTAPTAAITDGTSGQVLQTNGSGVLSFVDQAGADLYAANESSPTAQPSATGANAVAIGDTAVASNTNSFAIGTSTDATGVHSTALGHSAQATGTYAVGVGRSRAGGIDSFAAAIANNTSTYGAKGHNSISLGYQTIADTTGNVAIGYQAVAETGSRAVSLGKSYASGTDSFAAAIANNTSSYGATGSGSIAMGYQARATGTGSISLGSINTASGSYSVVIGYTSTASSNYSISMGRSNVASTQQYATAIGGSSNTASGQFSVVIGGFDTQATQTYSFASGGEALSDKYGKLARASGKFAARGDAQGGQFILRSDTTDATAEALTTNNSTAGTTNQVILPNNSAYSFSGTIIARESATDGSDYASWEIKGALLRDANAASTVLGNGIVNKLYATSGASAWAVALTADTTNGGLKVEVTGAAATNIRWVATVNTSEVTYA